MTATPPPNIASSPNASSAPNGAATGPDVSDAQAQRQRDQLLTIIKALVLAHGQPEATQPLSFTLVLTARELSRAHALTVTIHPEPANDIQPEPYVILTLEGI